MLAARDDLDGAVRTYEQLLAIDPDHPFGNYNYACVALVRSELPRAEALVAAALRARPDFLQALVVQSNVMDALGKLDAAVAALEAVLRLQPDDPGAWYNLGLLFQRQGRADEAEPAVRRALEADPGNTDTLAPVARVLREQGFAEQALVPLRAANERDPGNWAPRSLELLLMNFTDGIPAARLATPRRLRVGYLSGDLMMHSVSFFLIPILEHNDRSRVGVFCYS